MYYGLTNKENEIIELVYKFRFINRYQIQKILNHKDARRINTWLKMLTDINFIGRIYSHKLLENTKPAIYYLTGAGIRYMRDRKKLETKDVKKFYADKNASQKFIDHCINIAEFYTKTRVYARTSENEYLFFTKTESYTNELLSELKPDLYISKTKKKKIDRFFLDIFGSHVPRFALRYRIQQYIEFYDGWNQKEKFPFVLLVLSDTKKMKYLMRYIRKIYFDEDIRFQFTTLDKLLKEKITTNIWEGVSES